MTPITNATPLLAVADIDAAAEFLNTCLGFETTFRADGYAYCRNGDAGIRLIDAEPGADMADPARQHSVYIDCDDVDAFWADHLSAIEKLPSSHRRAPFDQDYGQREFHLIHGPFLFFVGQAINESP
ncbi:MAG: VOC family protein [Pseudomonadota bacterium]